MTEKDKDIDLLLNKLIGDAELDAPGIDWNAFQKKEKKKRGILFWWYAGAALLVLSLMGGLFLYNNNDNNQKQVIPVSLSNNQTLEPKTDTKTENQLSTDQLYENNSINTEKSPIQKALQYPKKESVTYSDMSSIDTSKTNINKSTDNEADKLNLSQLKLNDELLNRHSQIIEYKSFIYKFKPLESIGRTQLKLRNEGKNIFEISASGYAFNSIFKVLDVGKAFIHKDYESIRKSSERPIGGFDFRLGFGRKTGKVEWMLGFGYSRRSVQGQYDFIYTEKPVIDVDGRIIGYDVNAPKRVQYTSTQSLTFVEVPLYMRYQISQNKKHHILRVHLGFIPQFLKGINGQLPNAQFLDYKESLSPENFKNTILGAELGLSYLIPVGKGTFVNIQPYYTINSGFKQVTSYYSNSFQYFGLRAGLHMRL